MKEKVHYVDASNIYKIVSDELGMNHLEQLTFLRDKAKRTLSSKSIENALAKKRANCDAPIKKMLYDFDEKMPFHYDNVIKNYRNRLLKFFELCDLIMSKDCDPQDERITQYDITVIDGKISIADVQRITKPLVYCFVKLQEAVKNANSIKGYIGITLKKINAEFDGVCLYDLEPDEDIQACSPLADDFCEGYYIPWTEKQRKEFEEKKSESYKKICDLMNKIFI